MSEIRCRTAVFFIHNCRILLDITIILIVVKRFVAKYVIEVERDNTVGQIDVVSRHQYSNNPYYSELK